MGCISYNSSTSSEIQVTPTSFLVGWARWTLVEISQLIITSLTEESHKDVFNACSAGPNIDIFCVQLLNAAPFCENYAKIYFDAKHVEKGLNRGW